MSLPDKNDYSVLGGELADYSAVADPTTDLPAEASNEMRADVAAMTRTAIRAWCGFTIDGYAAPSISNTDYDAVYGNAMDYKPVVTRNSTGNYTIDFPTTVTDARGITHDLNLQCGFINSESSGLVGNAIKTDANTFNVLIYDLSGAASDPGTDKRILLFVL